MSNTNTSPTVVDTLPKVEACVADLLSFPAGSRPCIAVDVEGVRLSRTGRISLVQLKANHSPAIWLLDVTVLGNAAFNHPNATGTNIRQILESAEIRKLFYDVRSDADALYNLYGIDLRNATDVQIVELAFRMSHKKPTKRLNGLGTSIEKYLAPGPRWVQLKNEGVALFNPAKGGSYEVFEERPLHPTLVKYAAQDVALLSRLEGRLLSTMGRFKKNHLSWGSRIRAESERRVAEARNVDAEPKGPHRAFSPQI